MKRKSLSTIVLGVGLIATGSVSNDSNSEPPIEATISTAAPNLMARIEHLRQQAAVGKVDPVQKIQIAQWKNA
jgi:hypothetical protein